MCNIIREMTRNKIYGNGGTNKHTSSPTKRGNFKNSYKMNAHLHNMDMHILFVQLSRSRTLMQSRTSKVSSSWQRLAVHVKG